VLVSGDDIIWVAGYRASEFARADEETKRFLLLKVGMLSRGT
jgi:hypothetical protein